MKKNIKVGLLALAALFVAQVALGAVPVFQGDKIRFENGPGDSPGGAFNLFVYDSTLATSRGSFQSFCVETNETMSYGTMPNGPFYTVNTISTEARNGGSGGGSPDPLDNRTAWLYTQYMEGDLSTVGTWGSATAAQRGTAMQQAIWRMEGETQFLTSNALATALIAAAGNADWQDTGRVYVLNLRNSSGGYAQDQLYIAPIPEPEVYAMLAAGLGLMGFVARRRKQRVAA